MKWFRYLVVLYILFFLSGCTSSKEDYGVFIGMEKEQVLSLSKNYQTLVVDATTLQKEDLNQLHQDNEQLYAYLNVGALEKQHPYYDQFQHLAIQDYDNWPDESWLDVTDGTWRTFLVEELASELKEKGVDGLFLDNLDVYSVDQRPEVYQALKELMGEFKSLELKLIVNGGEAFIRKLLEEDVELAQHLITGVNQEEVVFYYDFDQKQAIEYGMEEKEYLDIYLAQLTEAGISVYTIEYELGETEKIAVIKESKQKGYRTYLAPSILLDSE